MIPFSHLLEAGVSGLVDAINALEKELTASRELNEKLDARIKYLENTQEHHKNVLENLTATGLPDARFARVEERVRELEERSVLDNDLEDKVRDLIDGALEDAIDSALSGREIEVNMTGTATL
jgi:vacuolar-type H+-ATPase subunit I/STV1